LLAILIHNPNFAKFILREPAVQAGQTSSNKLASECPLCSASSVLSSSCERRATLFQTKGDLAHVSQPVSPAPASGTPPSPAGIGGTRTAHPSFGRPHRP